MPCPYANRRHLGGLFVVKFVTIKGMGFGKWIRAAYLFFVVGIFIFSAMPLFADQEGQSITVKNGGCDWSKSVDDYAASAASFREKALYFLAIESYSCAIQIDPQRMQLYSFRANVLMSVGQFERAKADIQKVHAAEPHNSIPHVLLYIIDFEQGHYDDALAEIANTLELNALDSYSYLVRGQIYVQLNNEAKALEAFNQYFQLQKFSIFEAQGYAEIGFAYEHFGDTAAAERYLRQAVALHGDVGSLYLSLAQGYRARSNYVMALDNLNKAIRLRTPELVSAYTERAAVYMGLKNDAKALDDCEGIIQLQPQRPEGYVCKGAALIDMGQPKQALDHFNRAIGFDKHFVSAYGGRSVVEIMTQNYNLALSDLDFAIQSEPLVSNNYRLRAQVYTSLKNTSAAIADYETYLRLQGGAAVNPEIVEDIQRLQAMIANV